MNLSKLIHHEPFGCARLLAAALVAMVLANSPANVLYSGFFDVPLFAAGIECIEKYGSNRRLISLNLI